MENFSELTTEKINPATANPILGSNSYTLLRFQLRLKGSPIFAPLHRFKMDIAEGNPEVADLIFIP